MDVETAWEFVDGSLTGTQDTYEQQVITPMRFLITPIKRKKALAIIGRKENGVTGSDFPAIEIYYYSITGKAIMKLLRSHLMEDAKLEDSIGGRGTEDQSK